MKRESSWTSNERQASSGSTSSRLTFTDDDGRVLDMIERHGTVEYVDAEAGIAFA